MVESAPLELKLLGELEVVRSGERCVLPPSKKVRGLLAYLVLTRKPHRRERLCQLLWDVADDPRGALRWTLSRIRSTFDDEHQILEADRNQVRFVEGTAEVDVFAVQALMREGLERVSTERLLAAAQSFRGELLEGLELADFHEFTSWLVREREDARRMHATLRATLVDRLWHAPEDAVLHANVQVQVDPLDPRAHARFIRLLVRLGRGVEAEHHQDAALRIFKDVDPDQVIELVRLRDEITVGEASSAMAAVPPFRGDASPAHDTRRVLFVGRDPELARLMTLVDVAAERGAQVCLVQGEPGIGKTRLLDELSQRCSRSTLRGTAFEAERGRPYAIWSDVLRGVPVQKIDEGTQRDLAPLLPWLGSGDEQGSRERLYSAVERALGAWSNEVGPALLLFDDIQWCDEASIALLHAMIRALAARPISFVLAGRSGELEDNAAVLSLTRALRRARALQELRLGPLDEASMERLVHAIEGSLAADRIIQDAGGSPLLGIELAKARMEHADGVPETLADVIRDRVDRLFPPARDVLRWSAVFGRGVGASLLSSISGLGPQALMEALEHLERHTLLRASAQDSGEASYFFSHGLIQQVVYTSISEPRRRLMHKRIASALESSECSDPDPEISIAHHAALAGDGATAARACAEAGRRCLRVFANGEAGRFARRVLHYARTLGEVERVRFEIRGHELAILAERPEDGNRAADHILELAEQALDLGQVEDARLGFHLVSFLRWEEGAFSDAHRLMSRLEHLGLSAGPSERALAIGQAGHCLAILGRDLPRAEALLLEARALSARRGAIPSSIPSGLGFVRLHQGQLLEAGEWFEEARVAARREGERLSEFEALAQLVLIDLERGHWARAIDRCLELVALASKLRGGSEVPFARALHLVLAYASGEPGAEEALPEALEALRRVDAKHRLAVLLLHTSELDAQREAWGRGQARAESAGLLARALDLPSESVHAAVLRLRCLEGAGQVAEARVLRDQLSKTSEDGLSWQARKALAHALGQEPAAGAVLRDPSGQRKGEMQWRM